MNRGEASAAAASCASPRAVEVRRGRRNAYAIAFLSALGIAASGALLSIGACVGSFAWLLPEDPSVPRSESPVAAVLLQTGLVMLAVGSLVTVASFSAYAVAWLWRWRSRRETHG
jgi:hypothetical protein